jgi:hypothetical protein
MASSKSKSNASPFFGGRVGRKAATTGFVALAKKGTELTWRLGSGRKPPTNAGDVQIPLREVLLWSALSGAAVAVARALAVRQTSAGRLASRPSSDLSPDSAPTPERPSGGS